MAQLLSLDDAVAGAQELRLIYKPSLASMVAGQFGSLWTSNGTPSAGATPPTSGVNTIPTRATNGALLLPTFAGGVDVYLANFKAAIGNAGSLWLFDRLAHMSGLSGVVATAQAVNHHPLTRHTSGDGVSAFLEVYGVLGATGVTATVSYTNQAGLAGRSGMAAIPSNANIGRFIPVTLQAGDTGVRSVQSVIHATTGTAGNYGVTLAKIHGFMACLLANVGYELDIIGLNAQKIDVNACLMLAVLCSTTSTGNLFGTLGVTTK
jgi:hypothetical protein